MSGGCTIWNGNGNIVAAGTPGGKQSAPVPASRSAASTTRKRSAPGDELTLADEAHVALGDVDAREIRLAVREPRSDEVRAGAEGVAAAAARCRRP